MGRAARQPQALRMCVTPPSKLGEGCCVDGERAGTRTSLSGIMAAKSIRTSKPLTDQGGVLAAVDSLYLEAQETASVLSAIESLYDDQLKPYGRILRKRLGERAGTTSASSLDADTARLRAVCEASPWLFVEEEEGGEWSAVLVGRSPAFVDIYSTVDSYPPALWEAASMYFGSLDGPEAVLPGGRYACASALTARHLPFLGELSLGRVCHFVQLAISQRKLLGYLSGSIVPYANSQSMVKDCCALWQSPCASAEAGATDVGGALKSRTPGSGAEILPLATWDVARALLKEILDGAVAKGAKSLPLSNVKRLFRSQYHIELSETTLGHPKLSELLQDVRMSDICEIRLQGRGYIVLPSSISGPSFAPLVSILSAPLGKSVQFCQDEPLCLEEASASVATRFPLLSPNALSKEGAIGSVVRNTFIHAAQPLTPSCGGSALRSTSLPKNMGSNKSDWETNCNALSFLRRPIEECSESCADTEAESSSAMTDNTNSRESLVGELPAPRIRFCPDDPLCFEEAMLVSRMMPPSPALTASPQFECPPDWTPAPIMATMWPGPGGQTVLCLAHHV